MRNYRQQENAKIRDVALDIPKEIKVGKRKLKLHHLPIGYRQEMMTRLQKIADLVPKQEEVPVEQLAGLLKGLFESKDFDSPDELAKDLLGIVRQPGMLGNIMPNVPEIFDTMLEVIQLALQAALFMV